MRRLYTWLLLGWLLGARAWAADAPPVATSPPRTHKTACSLAESMAGKLVSGGPLSHDAAQRSCEALAPTMTPADHAEFMRCCISTLEKGAAAGKARPTSQPAPNPVQKM